MKAITTKYLHQTEKRPGRVKASDCDGNQITVPFDARKSEYDAYQKAVIALCEKMTWSGTLVGGWTQNGMVWVFIDDSFNSYQITLYRGKLCANSPASC